MLSIAADERAAVVFDDLASAFDAGLPLASLGGNAAAGDEVLHDLVRSRGVKLTATEAIVLRHGWKAGRGAETLRARARHRQQRAEFARTLWSRLRYPLLLFALLPVAGVATSAIIGPGFAIAIGCTYAVLAIAGVLLWRAARRGAVGVERWPVLGRLFHDVRELPYLETLHALYGAGVPIVEAHAAAVQSVQMRDLRDRLDIAQRLLASGEPLRDALAQTAALGLETRTLLTTGEQAGQLEDALARALTRRQQVAARTLGDAARLTGHIAYACAVVGVLYIVITFYSGYFGMISGARR